MRSEICESAKSSKLTNNFHLTFVEVLWMRSYLYFLYSISIWIHQVVNYRFHKTPKCRENLPTAIAMRVLIMVLLTLPAFNLQLNIQNLPNSSFCIQNFSTNRKTIGLCASDSGIGELVGNFLILAIKNIILLCDVKSQTVIKTKNLLHSAHNKQNTLQLPIFYLSFLVN